MDCTVEPVTDSRSSRGRLATSSVPDLTKPLQTTLIIPRFTLARSLAISTPAALLLPHFALSQTIPDIAPGVPGDTTAEQVTVTIPSTSASRFVRLKASR